MSGRSWLAPLTGILFIIVLFVAFTVSGEPPDPSEKPIDEVVDYYVDNKDDILIGSVLQGLAGALLLLFASVLYKALRRSGAESSAIAMFGGAVALAIGLALDGTINFAGAEAAEDVDPVAVQTIAALWSNDFLPVALGMFVFLIGFGAAVVNHGLFPKWMGWVAIVAGLTAISPAFPVAAIVAALLVIASSVMLTMRGRSEPTTPGPTTA